MNKVKEIESHNWALKSDNERLIARINELQQDYIRLKTDIATQDALKRNEGDQIAFKYESLIKTKDQTIQSLQAKIDELQHNNERVCKKIEKLQEQISDTEQAYLDKLKNLTAQKDRIIEDKNSRIAQLEEENKVANERIYRNNKFKQSVFSFDDGLMNPVNESFEVKSAGDARMMASYDNIGFSKFHPEPEPQIPGGTRDHPIELKPVRITSAGSNYSHEVQPPSPVFSKTSGDIPNSQRNQPEPMTQSFSNPSKNPYYMGVYHGSTMMMGPRLNMPPKVTQSQQENVIPRNFELETSQNDRSWYPTPTTIQHPPPGPQNYPFYANK